MKIQSTADNASAVADLQQKWPTLHDLDRARAVHAIHQCGTSLRKLAKELNCSPTLLGHLPAALKAPASDQILAREGKISTRELVHRAKAAGIRRAAVREEALQIERERAGPRGSVKSGHLGSPQNRPL